MKKLGLVGGTGPESTIPYYRGIVYGAQEKVGKGFFPNLTIESINVYDVLNFCEQEDYEGLLAYLEKACSNLVASKADFIAMSASTPHIVFDELQKHLPVPLVSIVESTANQARQLGMKRVGLLGTRFTMEADFFKQPFREKQIEVVIPNSEEIDYIVDKITNELEIGIVEKSTIEGFNRVIERLVAEEQINAVILGCTELPLLYKDAPAPIQTLDALELHVEAIVEKILED